MRYNTGGEFNKDLFSTSELWVCDLSCSHKFSTEVNFHWFLISLQGVVIFQRDFSVWFFQLHWLSLSQAHGFFPNFWNVRKRSQPALRFYGGTIKKKKQLRAWEKWTDQHDTSMGQSKNLSPRQEFKPMTLGGRSIHWATRTQGGQGHLTELCVSLVSQQTKQQTT